MPAIEVPRNEGVAIERRDVPLGLVAAIAAGIAAFFVVTSLVMMAAFPDALHGASDAPRLQTAKPRLQISPATDLAAYRAGERRTLDGYGWVDRRRGIVRIPIAQAMRDIAAGIKDWPGAGQ